MISADLSWGHSDYIKVYQQTLSYCAELHIVLPQSYMQLNKPILYLVPVQQVSTAADPYKELVEKKYQKSAKGLVFYNAGFMYLLTHYQLNAELAVVVADLQVDWQEGQVLVPYWQLVEVWECFLVSHVYPMVQRWQA